MKIPSISYLLNHTSHTIRRFPLPVLATVIGTGVLLYFIGEPDLFDDPEKWSIKLLMTCMLGLPLLLAVSLFIERLNIKTSFLGISYLGLAAGILIFYYFTLPKKLEVSNGIQFLILAIAFHLLVAFLPFYKKNNNHGFWQYNKSLFIRLLESVLYSGVLYLGLMLALLAINALFNVHISDKAFLRLGVIIFGLFNTLFFLSGIPKKLDDLEEDHRYPKGLKVFTQYVLLPLVVIYLIILYVYTAKILLNWEWPRGWVSYLVLGISISGILSFLLIWPLGFKKENKWINFYAKWYYIALYPLCILLFAAIYRRINEYGITENRYFVLALALWLVFISTFLLINKKKNIKIIPSSLFLIAVISAIGPFNAMNLSSWNQKNRLEKYLIQNNLLQNGKIVKTENNVPFYDRKQISSIISYLDQKGQLDDLQKYFDEPIDSITKDVGYRKAAFLLEYMGMQYVENYQTETDSTKKRNHYIPDFYYYEAENSINILNKNYDFLLDIGSYSSYRSVDTTHYEKDLILIFQPTDGKLTISDPKFGAFSVLLNPFAEKLIDLYKNTSEVPNEAMILNYENDSLFVSMYFRNLSAGIYKDTLDVHQFESLILIDKKE